MSLPSLSRGARDSMGSFPRCFPAVFPARASLSYFYAASFAIAPGAGAVAGSVGSATQQVSPNDPAELWAARSGPGSKNGANNGEVQEKYCKTKIVIPL